jgi:uncharacterized lipoprotein YddW (UPF0748 family)
MDLNGKLDPHAWLNPCHDRVRKFTIDLITDVVRRYPVADIQLDDYFSFPMEMGKLPFLECDRGILSAKTKTKTE